MKKIILMMVGILSVLIITTGCEMKKGYTFNVDTGDTIDIKINTKDNYSISSELPFKIIKEKQVLSQGMFITLDSYEQYLDIVKNDSRAKVIKQDIKDGLEYTFYSYNDTEYNYVIKVSSSKTGILLGNNISQSSAEDCFDRLTIKRK